MGFWNRQEVRELSEKIESLTKQIESKEIEKKGYFEDAANVSNEYIRYLTQHIRFNLIDFPKVDRQKLVNYYTNNAIVRGIIDTTIARAVGELVDYIELQTPDKKVLEKHWVLDLLSKPNDLFNKREFIKAWAINKMITGDAFIYAQKGIGLSKGQVKEMYVIPSQDVQIVKGSYIAPIKGYKLPDTYGIEADLTPDKVIFARDYNPDSTTYYGLSPLQSAANMVQLLEKADKRQNTSLENGGVNNIITPKPDQFGGVTDVQAKNTEESLNQNERTNFNKFLRVPVEIHKVGDTPADLTLLETSKYAVNVLCFVYGISIDTFLAQSKYENAKEAKKAVYEQAAIPLINEFLEKLNEFLKIKEGKLVLNTDNIEVLKASPLEVMQNLTAMGATLNEKRAYMGYEARKEKWCDEPILPLGVSIGDPMSLDINENANI